VEAHSREGTVQLSVIDDGVGLPEDLANRESKSLGLKIVKVLVRQSGGILEMKRDAGTIFRLSFRER
jgi:two-component system, sensor histidine kinase PdtaS